MKNKRSYNDQKKDKILIASVDENEISLIAGMISGKDFVLSQETSLKETLKHAVNELPDIIIASAGVNGFGDELVEEIKNNSLTKNISIVIITDPDESEKARITSLEIDDLLARPISESELMFRIDKILKNRKVVPEFNISAPQSDDEIYNWHEKKGTESHKPVILVVDDNRLIRTQLKDYVESLGYVAITAEKGQDAFRVTQENTLDLILLDLILPDLSGMDLLEMVRQQKNLLQLPVIIISGLSDSESKLKALEIGADDYITKPVNYEELQAKMKTVLRKKFYFEEVTQNYHQAVKRAITDSLTELYNHGYFHEFLEREIKRCRRYHHHLSLIIADIDYFKSYNDFHGHPKGDVVLKSVADILIKCTRSTDHVARYGGEEFAIVLPETDNMGSLIVAEKIRRTVEKHYFEGEENQPEGKLTISLGLSSIPALDENTDITQIIKKADQALYEAKKKGRNQVVSLPADS